MSRGLHVNPYESPPAGSRYNQQQADPLRGPAIAALVVSILAIAGSAAAFASLIALSILADLDVPQLSEDFVRGVLSTVLWLLFGLFGIGVWLGIKRRRRRWLVVIWSIVACATCLLAPLGALILMRLGRSDVWRSFD